MRTVLIVIGCVFGLPIIALLFLMIALAVSDDTTNFNNPYFRINAPAQESDDARVRRIATESYNMAVDVANVAEQCEDSGKKNSIACNMFRAAYVDNLDARVAIHISSTNKDIKHELMRTGRHSFHAGRLSYLNEMKYRVAY